jgi:hypothetical protein
MTIRQHVPKSIQPAVRGTLLQMGRATHRWRMDPSFIVIGGQRCGTTTIFKTLAEHPQVLRPPVEKGTDYYTLHYARGLDWYRGHMPLAPSRQLRTRRLGDPQSFEACTYYIFHPFAIERLAKDFPDVKLVAMLRNPVERAYSAYKHEFARGFDPAPSFMQALELEDTRLDGQLELMRADVSYESIAHRHHAYRHRGQFAEQLNRVYAFFPREQVHVMESESFFADPFAEYARLIDFLGLTSWKPARIDQYNARPSSSMPVDARAFLTEHYKQHDDELADLLDQKPLWMTG